MFIRKRPASKRIVWIARGIAIGTDALQVAIFPAFLPGAASPVSNALDVAVAIALTLLLGWNLAFVPSFLVKLLPFADLAPTWTVAVWLATRKGKSPDSSIAGSSPLTIRPPEKSDL